MSRMNIASTPRKSSGIIKQESFDYNDYSDYELYPRSSSIDKIKQNPVSFSNKSKNIGNAIPETDNLQNTYSSTPTTPTNINNPTNNTANITTNTTANITANENADNKSKDNQNSVSDIKAFIPRKVKYITVDDNGVKVENEIELKTIEDLHKIPSKYLTAQERVLLKDARWTPSQVLMAHLENKLNTTIGRYWWKKYVSAGFWSNIATPINLVITLFTTLTTGQAATDSLLSQDTFVRISIASLILSTLNTFFRPHQQTNVNIEAMNKWRQLGTKFEEIYYSECFNDLDFERRIKGYQELQKDIHTEQITQESAIQNYLTDLIYFLVSNSCLAKSEWITEKHKTIRNTQNNPIISNKKNNKNNTNDGNGGNGSNTNTTNLNINGINGTNNNIETDISNQNNQMNFANKEQIEELNKKYDELNAKYKEYEKIIETCIDIDVDGVVDNCEDIYLKTAIQRQNKK